MYFLFYGSNRDISEKAYFSSRGVFRMECADLSNFDISEETIKKLKATGITKLYKVQAETYEHIKKGQDVITLASE